MVIYIYKLVPNRGMSGDNSSLTLWLLNFEIHSTDSSLHYPGFFRHIFLVKLKSSLFYVMYQVPVNVLPISEKMSKIQRIKKKERKNWSRIVHCLFQMSRYYLSHQLEGKTNTYTKSIVCYLSLKLKKFSKSCFTIDIKHTVQIGFD